MPSSRACRFLSMSRPMCGCARSSPPTDKHPITHDSKAESIRQPDGRLTRKILSVVVIAHRGLRIGMARVSLCGSHVAVTGIKRRP
jgi:hypothetical protein